MLILAGIGISAAAFLIVGLWGGPGSGFANLLNFVDFSSFMCLYVPLVLFLGFSKNGGIFWGYIKSSFQKGYSFDELELRSIVSATKSTGRFAIGTGVFFFLTGIITVIANMNLAEDFTGLLLVETAVASFPVIYAIAFKFFILYPLQAWATNKLK